VKETNLEESHFPVDCPYTAAEIIETEHFPD
jgi:hypothetical protein